MSCEQNYIREKQIKFSFSEIYPHTLRQRKYCSLELQNDFILPGRYIRLMVDRDTSQEFGID